ncbi:MAG: dihydroorotate dehydrogenase electron transfer subunit [Candidatus Methanoperedens sp.]|nr:dihydroorotate dehydrogenase electron transfer subunit [Candidatus Methanoperedens sp.]
MKPVNVIITKVVDETPTIRTFFFDTSFELIPGRFVMVWIRGVDEIPMALSYENAITVQKVGPATSALFELEECDSFGIRGPYGTGFEIKNGSIMLIAGGVGAAPLAPLAEKISSNGAKITTLLGARTGDELLFRERFESVGELKVATDDGSEGEHGYVTELLEAQENLGICGACCVDGLRVCRDGPVFSGDVLKKTEFGVFRRNECGERVRV